MHIYIIHINIRIRVKCVYVYIVVWRRAFHRSHAVISGRGGRRMTNEHAHTRVDLYYYYYYYYCYYKFIHTHAHYTLILYIIIYIWRGLLYDGSGVRGPVDRVWKTNDRCTPRTSVLPPVFIFFFFFHVYVPHNINRYRRKLQ
jgi:hypothetical protein